MGIWYVLGGGRAVVWAPQGPKGAKKNLSAWPQGQGCGKFKNIRPIRLEGVKRYSSSASHFFTGRVQVLHGGCRSAPQRARFGSWALWWSAIADMRARAGQVRPGPSPQSPRSPSQAQVYMPRCRSARADAMRAIAPTPLTRFRRQPPSGECADGDGVFKTSSKLLNFAVF